MGMPLKATGSEVSSLRAWYGGSIADFLKSSVDTIFAQLAKRNDFDLISTQRDAWIEQIEFLRSSLNGLTGTLFLEFNIPRMGRRIDAVLLIGPVVFVVEFKVGENEFDRAAVEQVWDYALDLKNFHEASHHASLVPILVATNSKESGSNTLQVDADNVYRGGFKFEVRQLGRGYCPDISVPTQAPSTYGVRVCIETKMSSSL